MSCVTCQLSRVTCLMKLLFCYNYFFLTKWWSYSGEGLSSTGLFRLVSLIDCDKNSLESLGWDEAGTYGGLLAGAFTQPPILQTIGFSVAPTVQCPLALVL